MVAVVRHRPRTTWWDIAEELDVFCCDNGPSGCPSGVSPWMHRKGRVKDNIIHWDGFNRRTSTHGLRRFMVMVAYAKNPEFLEEPGWLGLYHADRWACHTEREKLKIKIPWEDSTATRREVKRRARKAHVSLRYDQQPIFWWANWKPERAKMRTPVRSSLNG